MAETPCCPRCEAEMVASFGAWFCGCDLADEPSPEDIRAYFQGVDRTQLSTSQTSLQSAVEYFRRIYSNEALRNISCETPTLRVVRRHGRRTVIDRGAALRASRPNEDDIEARMRSWSQFIIDSPTYGIPLNADGGDD